jgi:hypothetical protein
MVASPVLACAVLGHYEWNESLSRASGGLSLSAAGGGWECTLSSQGSAMGAWWSALDPAVMIMEWGHCGAAALAGASATGRQRAAG